MFDQQRVVVEDGGWRESPRATARGRGRKEKKKESRRTVTGGGEELAKLGRFDWTQD